jgi:cephalosporin hydroxylase
MRPLLDWTVRQWLEHFHRTVHLGSVHGTPQLQQRWLGRLQSKNPLDCWVYQEILHETRPDLVIELGVAQGGTTLYLAHLMDLVGHGEVVGVDLDMRRARDLKHDRVSLVEGNCLDPRTIEAVASRCRGRRTMVIADCDHGRDHVLGELHAYSSLVAKGCYYVVEDTICDVMGWQPVPGPHAAVEAFLEEDSAFANDGELREKFGITYNFDGYLKRVGP